MSYPANRWRHRTGVEEGKSGERFSIVTFIYTYSSWSSGSTQVLQERVCTEGKESLKESFHWGREQRRWKELSKGWRKLPAATVPRTRAEDISRKVLSRVLQRNLEGKNWNCWPWWHLRKQFQESSGAKSTLLGWAVRRWWKCGGRRWEHFCKVSGKVVGKGKCTQRR